MKKMLVVMALLVVFCSPVYAAIMTFDSLPNKFNFPLPYTEDGITVSSPRPFVIEIFNGGFREIGSIIRFDMGGSLFDLVAINFGYVGPWETDLRLINNLGDALQIGPFLSSNLGLIDFTSYSQFSGISFFDIYAVLPGTTDVYPNTVHFDSIQTSVSGPPVPEPGTMLLLGSGLVGLVGYGRRRFNK